MYDTLGQQIAEHEAGILRRMKELESEQGEGKPVPALRKPSKAKTLQRRQQEPMRGALYAMTGMEMTAIHRVGVETMEAVVSEYGPRLDKFRNEKAFVKHLLAPRQNISCGKASKAGVDAKAQREWANYYVWRQPR